MARARGGPRPCDIYRTDAEILGWLTAQRNDPNAVFAVQKRERAKKQRQYRAANPSERIKNATRARMWAALKGRTDSALFSRLGYTAGELVRHIEALFTGGMAWENYGKWHVDHRKPCALFDLTDPRQFDECWKLTNLQPLWAGINFKKGASYVEA